MTTAGYVQLALLLGVLAPLASFVLLILGGTRLGGGQSGATRSHLVAADRVKGYEAHLRPGEPLAGWLATASIGFSLLMSAIALLIWAAVPPDSRVGVTRAASESAWVWTYVGHLPIHIGINLDSLTIIMYFMVTLCATCIHIFSIGYMAGDPRFSRFFAYLSLFCFSMLGLVISSNLLLVFIFWELVGICSYLLIGFWFEKRSASTAAIKAFVVNRVGDFGFLIGLAMCIVYLDTLSLRSAPEVFEAGAHQAGWIAGELTPAAAQVRSADAQRAGALFTTPILGVTLATWLGIGLFCGAIGKSAQFPLHVWLPDAMEGPTPVSDLIHAATMVAAGVYLTARIFTLLTPGALQVVMTLGCVTLALGGLLAIVQTDIKRVLAYSTISQLGYMIFALGIGAWTAALFHLLTHAFFKALMFLGAGQVIAGTHHQQDMRRMGGLWRKMPRTATTFLIGVLAISGAGIPWTPIGLGGFYSKDEILAVGFFRDFEWKQHEHDAASHEAARAQGAPLHEPSAAVHAAVVPQNRPDASHADEHGGKRTTAPLATWLFIIPVAVAYLTPFYMGRCFVLTFLGRPRDPQVYHHAHESPIMYAPLLVLAFMTIVSGGLPLFRSFVSYAAPAGVLAASIDAHHDLPHAVHAAMPLLVGFSWIVGLGLAYGLYAGRLATAERLSRLPLVSHARTVLLNRLYIDRAYDAVFVGGAKAIATLARVTDAWLIDGIVHAAARATAGVSRFSGVVLESAGVDGLVNGVGRLCWTLGGALRATQTGVIRHYVTLAALSVACVLVSLWSLPLGIGLAAVGVSIMTRSATLAIVIALAAAVIASWPEQRGVAVIVLAVAGSALIVLGSLRRTDATARTAA